METSISWVPKWNSASKTVTLGRSTEFDACYARENHNLFMMKHETTTLTVAGIIFDTVHLYAESYGMHRFFYPEKNEEETHYSAVQVAWDTMTVAQETVKPVYHDTTEALRTTL
jgi:hypothetical protein